MRPYLCGTGGCRFRLRLATPFTADRSDKWAKRRNIIHANPTINDQSAPRPPAPGNCPLNLEANYTPFATSRPPIINVD